MSEDRPELPVSRHASNPQWDMITTMCRCTLHALTDFTAALSPAAIELITLTAADRYFEAMEESAYRAMGAVDCGRTVQ